MKTRLLAIAVVYCTAAGLASAPNRASAESQVTPLPECEWCGAPEAPPNLKATLIMPTKGEAGGRLIIEGTVYEADGRSPAAGVLLYAYHTNAAGVYARRGDERGNGRRHGYLRGWLRTGADGRYRIETIKPGSYPTRSEPAHVHMTLQPPGEPERYIDDVVFDGDPLLTSEHRARLHQRGGSGIVSLAQGTDGILRARRDIYLGRQ